MDTQTCSRCGEARSLDRFELSRGRPRSVCKDCRAAARRESRIRDPGRAVADREAARRSQAKHHEKKLARDRAYHHVNRESRAAGSRDRFERNRAVRLADQRMRDRGARGVVDHDYCEILEHDVCSYCGGPAGTVDHIDADLTQGTFENLTAACGLCNSKKRQKPLLRFMLDSASSAALAAVDAAA